MQKVVLHAQQKPQMDNANCKCLTEWDNFFNGMFKSLTEPVNVLTDLENAEEKP